MYMYVVTFAVTRKITTDSLTLDTTTSDRKEHTEVCRLDKRLELELHCCSYHHSYKIMYMYFSCMTTEV